MRIKIYQINPDRDKNNVKFNNLKNALRFQGKADIDPSMDSDNLE